MHVKYSSRLTKLTVVLSLFFVAILFAETMMDYARARVIRRRVAAVSRTVTRSSS